MDDSNKDYLDRMKAMWPGQKKDKKENKKKAKKKKNKETDNLTADVLIIISGGAVQSVRKAENVTVEIHDYDVENEDAENDPRCEKDENGDYYQKMRWGNGSFGME